MMNFQSILFLLSLTQVIRSAPIVVTRMHTAEAVTVTNTYATDTYTVTAPTVEILISDGVSYTFTLTDADQAQFPQPTTYTTVFNNKGATGPTQAIGGQPEQANPTPDAPQQEQQPAPTPDAPQQEQQPAPTTAPAPAPDSTPAPVDAPNPAQGSSTTTLVGDSGNNNNNGGNGGANNGNNSPSTTSSSTSLSVRTLTPATTIQSTTHQAPTALPTTIATSKNQPPPTSIAAPPPSPTNGGDSSNGKLTKTPNSLVYSPYNDDNSCKDYDTVFGDLNYIKNTLGVSKIRIYGTDCNSVTNVQKASTILGIKINQGFWISQDGADSIDDGVDAVIQWASVNGWGVFDYITVGNEAIQFNYVTVDQLMSKIGSVRQKLRAAGYNGQITTSEPPHMFVENPELCTSGVIDFVGVNPHSYFDPYSSASTSGSFVRGQVNLVAEACGNINIVVTETGYPSAGIQNGGNIPSKANQLIAVQSILDEFNGDVTILSTFNDYWKNPGEYGIEQSFGIWDILQ